MPDHFCQYDVSGWPSHSFENEFNDRCCGAIAKFTLPDAPDVWACAEHYDEWMTMYE